MTASNVAPAVGRYVRVASLADVQVAGCLPLSIEGNALALWYHKGKVYAIDNRCPHMGFPLSRGSVQDGVLTCHWHHARFDLSSGGTFDQWADELRSYPVETRGADVWVDLEPRADQLVHQRQRLRDGLERDIPLVIAKAVIALVDGGGDPTEPFRVGLEFGTRYRQVGWGQGLTIHTCMMNLLPHLEAEDRLRALHHGLAAVARDSADMAPRFMIQPLPGSSVDLATMKRWFRQFVEVRDAEGSERCIVSAVRTDATPQQVADMLFAAATDHRYIQTGHVLDFTNKAFEALDCAGWHMAEPALASLATSYANADRMEESNAWRHPIDLVAILERAFERLPAALEQGQPRHGLWDSRDALSRVLLGADPQAIADALLEELRQGAHPDELAGAVAYAAALRIARFHISNEFGDWDTALHTFTFANAVHLGLRRTNSPELVRGAFDAAMSVYLNRFLNVPPAALPEPHAIAQNTDALLAEIPILFDRQQRVDEAGTLVSRFLSSGGSPNALLVTLGRALLREDRDFHTIQTVEATFRQYGLLGNTPAGTHMLIAGARYLAAHAPTVRAQGQAFQIARRLSRGERLFE